MTIDTVLNKKRPAEILLVEDNLADAVLAQKAFSSASVPTRITVTQTGEAAMELLHNGGPFDMVLLDLNLPGRSGVEVLREVKSDKKLWRIPVVVLTTSRAQEDVTTCYDLLANSYVIKPLDFTKFRDFVEALSQFWFAYAVSPCE